MAVKIQFDSDRTVKSPTIVLANRSGGKLGAIPYTSLRFEESFNSGNTIDFKVFKKSNGIEAEIWDELKDFKLIWCKEWDAWFEITVDTDEGNELIKSVSGKSIGEAELSVIKLFEVQINTEDDIAREDYVPTVIYNPFNHNGSLLHRIFEKIPHYTIQHVDSTIANIQRTFTFDGTSIYDALQQISEEIECLFIISQKSDANGKPERGIYVYDLLDYCQNCGYRGNFTTACTECGSTNFIEGYGDDTTIFISNENLASELSFTTDTNSVCTCFRMEAGDDLMTATLMNINPNGTQYLWYISEDVKSDMSDSMVSRLASYDTLYAYYQNQYVFDLGTSLVNSYNSLITRYRSYNDELSPITSFTGYPALIDALYNTVDMNLFLTSGLMPNIDTGETSASEQAALLTVATLSPIAVSDLTSSSSATVELNILAMARAIVNSSYSVSVKQSSYNPTGHTWTGILTVKKYSNENDTADTAQLGIQATDNYQKFVQQKIEKSLYNKNTDSYDVCALFKKQLVVSGGSYSGEFANAIKEYALNILKGFHESCQSVLDILVEEGISDSSSWNNQSPNLYTVFYDDYYKKLQAIDSEISTRESELSIVKNLNEVVNTIKGTIQNTLDFKNYLGETMWKDFCAYRRESNYHNDNYISDGLSNTLLIANAREFIKVAQKELVKSATYQHSIKSSLYNLLIIPEFSALLDHFEVGNWLRIRLDGNIYKLRLIRYSIDFDSLDGLEVDFSDVVRIGSEVTDIESILNQSQSVASSYNAVERQSNINSKTTKIVDTWFEDGLNATLTKIVNSAIGQTMTWDEHGILMRQYDDASDTYSPEQLKIINSTLAVTDDNWKTTKTAIGKFFYKDPTTGNLVRAYGVNAETVVGKLIIGQSLGLYNSGLSMKFDSNGLTVSNSTNTVYIDPNNVSLMRIVKGSENIFSVDYEGNLSIKGNVTATSGTFNGKIVSGEGAIGGWAILEDCLASDDLANLGYYGNIFFFPNGSDDYASIGGSENINGWTIAVGNSFGVNVDGSLYSSDACISGTIYAGYGMIGMDTNGEGGWTIDTYELYSGEYGEDESFYMGTDDLGIAEIAGVELSTWRLTIGSNFGVTNEGKLYAKGVHIRGVIEATSIIANSRYIIHGDNEVNSSDPGVNFTIMQGNGETLSSGTQRSLGIGTNFISAGVDYYTSVPQVGILIQQNTGSGTINGDLSIRAKYVTIGGNTLSGGNINFADQIDIKGAIINLTNNNTQGVTVNTGGITATGGASFGNDVSVTGDFSANSVETTTGGIISSGGSIEAAWNLTIYGYSYLYSDLTVYAEISSTGKITSSNGLTVSSGKAIFTDGNVYIQKGNNGKSQLYSNSQEVYFKNIGTGTGSALVVSSSNSVLIGSSSAKKYKNHIGFEDIDDAFKLLNLPVVKFKYKKGYLVDGDRLNDKEIVGLYADDVAQYFDDAIICDEEGNVENYKDRQLLVRLIKLVQIQNEEIETLKSEMRGIKNEN